VFVTIVLDLKAILSFEKEASQELLTGNVEMTLAGVNF